MTLRLTLRPHSKPSGEYTGKFDASIGADFICRSREPLGDGARILLARGYNPETLITTRHAGKDFDNFKPMSIGKAAGLTTREDTNGPRIIKYEPHPNAARRRAHRPPARVAAE